MIKNNKSYNKGFTFLIIALPLLLLGPLIIHSSFKNQEHPFFEIVLCLGLILCGTGVYLSFKGLITVVKTLFEQSNQM